MNARLRLLFFRDGMSPRSGNKNYVGNRRRVHSIVGDNSCSAEAFHRIHRFSCVIESLSPLFVMLAEALKTSQGAMKFISATELKSRKAILSAMVFSLSLKLYAFFA